jgi:hypothetical protein
VPALGLQGAADLYRAFIMDALESARRVESCTTFIFYAPEAAGDALRDSLDPSLELVPQNGTDLGHRMHNAFTTLFARGFGSVVVVGTDLPTLPLNRLTSAFTALERKPVVLGPSLDGGYYLIGLRAPCPALFQGVEWSTSRVLAQTVDRINRLRLKVECLEPWYDVDTPTDLGLAVAHLRLLLVSGAAYLPRHTLETLRRLGRLP